MRQGAEQRREAIYELIGDARARAQETAVVSEVLRGEASALVSKVRKTRADARKTVMRRRELTRS